MTDSANVKQQEMSTVAHTFMYSAWYSNPHALTTYKVI